MKCRWRFGQSVRHVESEGVIVVGNFRKIIGWVCILIALLGVAFDCGDGFFYSFVGAAWINFCCGDVLLEMEKQNDRLK